MWLYLLFIILLLDKLNIPLPYTEDINPDFIDFYNRFYNEIITLYIF